MLKEYNALNDLKRVILHIGSHKTGTSSIQRFLHNSRAQLLDKGLFYPIAGTLLNTGLAPGHHDFARKLMEWNAGENRFFLDILKQLDAEIPIDRADTIILSAEDLFQLYPPDILRDLFYDKELDIYVTLRPQHEMLTAMYYTAVTHKRDIRTPEEYADFFLPLCDYSEILLRWKQAFPNANFNLRLFERHRSPRLNPVKDFVVVNGIGLHVGEEDNVHEHPSLTARPTLLMRSINKFGYDRKDYYSFFNQLHRLGKELGNVKSPYSPDFRKRVYESFRGSNATVRKTFYDRISGDLFAEPELESIDEWSKEVGDPENAVRECMLQIVRMAASTA